MSISPFPRLPSVWDGPMVSPPDLASPVLKRLEQPARETASHAAPAFTVTLSPDVAGWLLRRGGDVAAEVNAILRAHILAESEG
jgi:hypothetical protein